MCSIESYEKLNTTCAYYDSSVGRILLSYKSTTDTLKWICHALKTLKVGYNHPRKICSAL